MNPNQIHDELTAIGGVLEALSDNCTGWQMPIFTAVFDDLLTQISTVISWVEKLDNYHDEKSSGKRPTGAEG